MDLSKKESILIAFAYGSIMIAYGILLYTKLPKGK